MPGTGGDHVPGPERIGRQKGKAARRGGGYGVRQVPGQGIPAAAGREEGIRVAVEAEFSVKSGRRMEAEKLRSYRLAPFRLERRFTMLMTTVETLVAGRFGDPAGDL